MIDKNSKLQKMMDTCKAENNSIVDSRICIINQEFKQGFELMKKYPKSVTIFGSARLPEDDEHSKNATKLARRLSLEGYAIATGGGHGIMGAAHKGSSAANGASVGINIELPFEQTMNQYITDSLDFHHFFSRKVILAYSAEAYIYFAGGFGTLDELFEIATLIQTKKIPAVPVILFGTSFWNPIMETLKKVFLDDNQTISPEDMDIFTITDDIEKVLDIVKSSPIRAEVSDRFNLNK